jgi:hypothetical protein
MSGEFGEHKAFEGANILPSNTDPISHLLDTVEFLGHSTGHFRSFRSYLHYPEVFDDEITVAIFGEPVTFAQGFLTAMTAAMMPMMLMMANSVRNANSTVRNGQPKQT